MKRLFYLAITWATIAAPHVFAEKQCDWYGDIRPLCKYQDWGWGWENYQSCIGIETCKNQAGGGVIGGEDETVAALSDLQKVVTTLQQSLQQLDAQLADRDLLIQQQTQQINTLTEGLVSLAASLENTNGALANVETLATLAHNNTEELQLLFTTLTQTVAELDSGSGIAGLASYLSVEEDEQGYPAIVFSGANIYIDNGSGNSNNHNGVGNLIVGYNEENLYIDTFICSLGFYNDQNTCEANGGIWSTSHKSGSHNVVIGPHHNYSSHGGIVAGFNNNINSAYASVISGHRNTASGEYSMIASGYRNETPGEFSAVLGGSFNSTTGDSSTIAGGDNNVAGGIVNTVSGGVRNSAFGTGSSVSGGNNNEARGNSATVSGGGNVTAAGNSAWNANDGVLISN